MAPFRFVILALAGPGLALAAQDPPPPTVAERVATTYAEALKKADAKEAGALKASQADFERRRGACPAKEKEKCVREISNKHIAELQARYKLIPGHPPRNFVCDGNPKNVVRVVFYDTTPQTLMAEWGGKTSLMYVQPSARGAKYAGPNETFWEHHGIARIIWGRKTSEMYCKPTA
jgi:hypothetical protein